jgi:hypothetical protein
MVVGSVDVDLTHNNALTFNPGHPSGARPNLSPAEWMGVEVWGTGGEIGFSIDGSSLEQASVIGITYLAAWVGIVEYARLVPRRNLAGVRRRRRGRQCRRADREVARCLAS